jgi:hypothetical protein
MQAVTGFCEYIVPRAVLASLLHAEGARAALARALCAFFEAGAELGQEGLGQGQGVRVVLGLLGFLRTQAVPREHVPPGLHNKAQATTAWDSAVHWVPLDLLNVAETAFHAKHYFTALQYTELHCSEKAILIDHADGAGAALGGCLERHLALLEKIYSYVHGMAFSSGGNHCVHDLAVSQAD